ncbi:hypothetical protein SK128_021274 [Halocaridina rubra]|uniref:Uncharacterized protein n=1 Tax=Halocaridina rubra TaxID=373956 RepID=A0AAN8WM50_HALRR
MPRCSSEYSVSKWWKNIITTTIKPVFLHHYESYGFSRICRKLGRARVRRVPRERAVGVKTTALGPKAKRSLPAYPLVNKGNAVKDLRLSLKPKKISGSVYGICPGAPQNIQ